MASITTTSSSSSTISTISMPATSGPATRKPSVPVIPPRIPLRLTTREPFMMLQDLSQSLGVVRVVPSTIAHDARYDVLWVSFPPVLHPVFTSTLVNFIPTWLATTFFHYRYVRNPEEAFVRGKAYRAFDASLDTRTRTTSCHGDQTYCPGYTGPYH